MISRRTCLLALTAMALALPRAALGAGDAAATSQPISLGAEARSLSARASMTTAAFERSWSRYEEPALRDAGIADDKIRRLKDVDIEARAAWSAGERDVPQALAEKREAILTTEEGQRFRDAQRDRRKARHAANIAVTSATRGEAQATSRTAETTAPDSATTSSEPAGSS